MPIYSFSGEMSWTIAIVEVLVSIGQITTNVEFFVMNIDSPYNAILGKNWLGEIKVVTSPFHQKLKFPSRKWVVVVRGKQDNARYYFNLAVQGALSENQLPPEPSQVVAMVEMSKSDGKSTIEKGEYSSAKGKKHKQ